ncbi:MAG: di-trans,poly-cis-decaprenylcistransferase [Treponema sp.]|uniref:polyprenyl diphosphate synthase n=1 Tax=Treponema sp. TaxID=166 RepID=UPI0025CFF7AF|nr:polyprenyl diphosphate synthase [Treponema sp.]MBQ9281084.1 di-trans,poly-cis-decaprenylcistransferase [Treponema sp.]
MTAEEIIARGVPEHVAVIMDGNGRWAKKRGLPRTSGHKEGLVTAKKIVAMAAMLGIKYLTFYTFSTENWKRAQEEVGYLMSLITSRLRAEFDFYKENGIRIAHIGDLDGLPAEVRSEIQNAIKDTEHFKGITCVLAINYGGRDEIIRGVKKLISDNVSADSITEESFSKSFDVPNLPDVDLMIRTGGEERLSNFLLWHCAYAEFVFTDTLWPDYNENEFLADISIYQQRNRRFGAVPN